MQVFFRHHIIPVLSVDDSALALDAVAALKAGGIQCVEVALRSSNALKVLAAVAAAHPDMEVGAGTLRQPEDFNRVIQAGAKFAVSPGCTDALLEAARSWDLPYLPAAATVSEVLAIQQAGISLVKIFPAASLGGVKFLKDISAPLPDIKFIPSGGVNLDNLTDYLALDAVPAVSGSWMLGKDLIASKQWSEITRLSAQSLKLVSA